MQAVSYWVGSLFGATRRPTVESDEVYPLNFLDNLATGRVIVLCQTLKFNQVLDSDKLHDGLVRLIQQGDWRKLGGRLRTQANGYLEVHVPKDFTQERPAIRFTTQVFDIAIEDHGLGRQLPEPTDNPSLQPGPTAFRAFAGVSDVPSTLEDYLNSDRPILSLHVTSFTNSTVVSLIWPHAIAGALGLKEILSAWSKALNHDQDIPALLGTREDFLETIVADAGDNAPQYALAPKQIKGWGFFKFALRLLWTVFWRPTVECRTLCLPRQFISQLRLSSMKELEATQPGGPHFLSEGDVLTAWASRFVAHARGGKRPTLIFNPIDITGRLKAFQGTEGVFVQNLASAMYTTLDTETSLKKPFGELSLAIRQSIQLQATEEQICAQLRLLRNLGHEKIEPLYGESDSHLVAFSNWAKFNHFGAVDFGLAVSKVSSSNGTGTPVGKPVFMHCLALGENRFQRDCFGITGKDLNENYWITVFLYPEDWASFGDYIQETWNRIK